MLIPQCAGCAPERRADTANTRIRWGKRRRFQICYDGAIMMARTQITLEPETHRRARRRASDLGISLAEYLRGLVARDLGCAQATAGPTAVFDLGSSGGSDIATHKDAMIAEALASAGKKTSRA